MTEHVTEVANVVGSFVSIDQFMSIVVTLMGALGTTLPMLSRIKTKLNQVKALVVSLDSALEDDKLTPGEIKIIVRQARELLGTKKI